MLRQQSDGRFTGGQQVVQVLQGHSTLPGRRRVQGLPDRLNPARSNEFGDVLAIDSLRIARVDGQLFDLGRQDSRLGADQFHQETRRVGIEFGVIARPARVG